MTDHFQLNTLESIRRVITHRDCADGTASAMILNHAFGGKVPIEFVQYGTPEWRDLKPEAGIMFADMTPPPELADVFVEAGAIVLDHHKKAKDLGIIGKFADKGLCRFGDEKMDPGVCGATLAAKYVWEPVLQATIPGHYQATADIVQNLAHLAGVYDTWQRTSPDWNKAFDLSQALKFWPWDDLRDLYPDEWADKIALGRTLSKKLSDRVKRTCENAMRFTTEKGTRVIVFEGTRDTSYVAEVLDKEVDLVVGFSLHCEKGENPTMGWSTRSHTDFDCNMFCSTLGGGGHTKAAGGHLLLKPDDPNPFSLVRNTIESYERAR
jgi:oligoribonuclease NrnB/cAMP/cGMP phosphodiesterase (DHH superfamily)